MTSHSGHAEYFNDLNTRTPSVFMQNDIFAGYVKNPPSFICSLYLSPPYMSESVPSCENRNCSTFQVAKSIYLAEITMHALLNN